MATRILKQKSIWYVPFLMVNSHITLLFRAIALFSSLAYFPVPSAFLATSP